MPSLKTIRTRIQSVKSTQKITRAMKMVAGARLARAQQRIVTLRPYAIKTGEVLRQVVNSIRTNQGEETLGNDKPVHPLLLERTEQKALFVVLTSDRGLCGAFNSNLYKVVEQQRQLKQGSGIEVSFCTIGRKGRELIERRGIEPLRHLEGAYETFDLSKAYAVSQWMVPHYFEGKWDAIYLLYNEFKSTLTQKPVVEKLLPVGGPGGRTESLTSTYHSDQPLTASQVFFADDQPASVAEYLYEPTRFALLEQLIPMYLTVSLYRAMLESHASELSARMTAMDSATRNANEMMGRLTLLYNRARQAAITKELIEIIGGAEAINA